MAKHEQKRSYNLPIIIIGIAVLLALVPIMALTLGNSIAKPKAFQSLTMSPVPTGSGSDGSHSPGVSSRASTSSGPASPTITVATPSVPTPSPAVTLGLPFLKCASSLPANYVCYKVQPGDNLFYIAKAFANAGLSTVYSWNQTSIGQDPNLIHPGLILVVKVL
jgi:hypothetical protein